MYKCCFLTCFCPRQRVQWLRAEQTLAHIREKLPKGWTDWHQMWHTCADSSGNGCKPNKLHLETQGDTGGGFRGGQQFKSFGKLSNGRTDWHRIWFTSAASSGNGHTGTLKKIIRLTIPQGGIWGFRGSTIPKTGKCGQTAGPVGNKCCTYNADESGNGHRLTKLAP